ncbi:unnamed protein product [Fusarium graminearum]|nr:unnamed protein product [Fusarium graminearum]CAG1963869.1 unnamed protein product [Fusarium graminearum]CAG1985708.1 unnamed protein product [Fusarium graminearum]VTO81369.1 unnamed protein product [Fusarium graminearum]
MHLLWAVDQDLHITWMCYCNTARRSSLEKRPYLKFYDPKEAALREKIWCPLHDCLDQVDAGSVECLAQANLVLIANQGHLQQ